jgi:hypothetical protein
MIAAGLFARSLGRTAANRLVRLPTLVQHSPPCRFAPFARAAQLRAIAVRIASGTAVAKCLKDVVGSLPEVK